MQQLQQGLRPASGCDFRPPRFPFRLLTHRRGRLPMLLQRLSMLYIPDFFSQLLYGPCESAQSVAGHSETATRACSCGFVAKPRILYHLSLNEVVSSPPPEFGRNPQVGTCSTSLHAPDRRSCLDNRMQNPENPVGLGNLFDRVPKSTFQHHRRLKSPTSDDRGAGSYISDNGGA